jgi:hypothetical protein
MIDFLKGQKKKAEEEYEQLMEQRRNASPEAVGGIQNRIDNVLAELKRLDDDIKIEESKSVSIKNIYFFVIVSTKEKVKTNLGECCQHLNDARYHSTDCSQWKPFNRKEETIQVILDNISQRYPIQVEYFDGELNSKNWVNIDKHIHKSITIIDLLSLDDTNKATALRFDSGQSKLLLPLCRRLNDEILTFAENMRTSFKILNAYVKENIDCMFFSEVSSYETFSRNITHIITTHFPITNQSKTDNPVRGIMSMNNSIQ